ncbi:hypothetical protein hamaS1_11500 [Moorella sp. Hama-1]|nr:hypothetical protein hamaS1_11500 [Moorella sp. Hama-1]
MVRVPAAIPRRSGATAPIIAPAELDGRPQLQVGMQTISAIPLPPGKGKSRAIVVTQDGTSLRQFYQKLQLQTGINHL